MKVKAGLVHPALLPAHLHCVVRLGGVPLHRWQPSRCSAAQAPRGGWLRLSFAMAVDIARWWDAPLATGCRRLPQHRWQIASWWVALMSLPADLRPLQWNLVARRRVSSFSLFDGGVRSGGVTLRDGTTTSMVGVGGVLVPDEGDHWWLVSCAWGTSLHCGGHDSAVSRSSKIAACLC
jgi:hypothetical protein